MKRIIVSNNSLLQPLYSNAISNINSEYKIDKLSDLSCIAEINKSNFEFALINPLVYTNIIDKGDHRIIKGKMLTIEDYTGYLTLNIIPNKKKLEKIYFEELNEYLITITKLVLSERFGLEPQLVGNPSDADIILSNQREKYPDYLKLDLTEDWFDTFEIPLIMGFWIAENGKINDKLLAEIDSLMSDNIDKETLIKEAINANDYEQIGYKYWTWNDRFETALDKTFDLLFYRNFANHIADVKFNG